jgi:hypothetical protein
MNKLISLILSLLIFTPSTAFGQFTAVQEQSLEKNYVGNGGFENGIAGWKSYSDAAGALPVDGTGGTANVTIAASTTSPIDGKASGVFTKDAANRQGQGVAIPFVVQPADRGKILTISGVYQIASGTFSGGTSSTDSDVVVSIYDVDAAQVIQPAGFKLDGNQTGISYPINATFQTHITSANYRLILHVATTSASAYSLKLDRIKIGPLSRITGPPVTDWQSYTPTGSWVSNTTYTGFWRRVGDQMEVTGQVALTGAPTATSLTFSLPSGYSIDFAKLEQTTLKTVGKGILRDAGTDDTSLMVEVSSTTSVQFRKYQGTGVAHNTPITFANGDSLNFTFTVPIVGWGSSVVMSDSADSRVVAFTADTNSAVNVTASLTAMTFATVKTDTHGGWNGSTTYTVKVPGFYDILATTYVQPGTSSASTAFAAIQRNGSTISGPNAGAALGVNGQIYPLMASAIGIKLNSGDTIQFMASQNSGSSVTLQGNFSIMMRSGPSQVAATESVIARYQTDAGQSGITTGTIVNYEDKIIDTHNAVTTGANWKFTAPVSGKYRITVSNETTGRSDTVGNLMSMRLHKNTTATSYVGLTYVQTTSSVAKVATGSDLIELKAGDYIDLRLEHSLSAGSVTLGSNANTNYVVIERVGN